MPCGISSASVNFAWVFPAECSATVSAFAAVSINNYFPSCKAGITVRSPYYKFACWVNVIFYFIVEQMCILWILILHTLNQNLLNIIRYFFQHLFFVSKIIVLCRNHNRVYALGFTVVTIFECNLAFCI